MTTDNAWDEKWSEWIDWSGGDCPISSLLEHEVKLRCGDISTGRAPDEWRWKHYMVPTDIIAYRYKIKEPESDMHPDLEWLARNVSEWRHDHLRYITKKYGFPRGCAWNSEKTFEDQNYFTKAQWLQARKDLGLIMSDAEEEIPAPEWAGSVPEGVQTYKQLRYQDAKGEDWIDEFARTASVDEFRGAMKFTLGKYNRRAGKKDELVREIEKMRDYCDRWIEYERSL